MEDEITEVKWGDWMVLREDIIMLISIVVVMAFMILVAKYIFFEKCFTNRKSWIVFWMAFLFAECCTMFIPGELGEDLMFLILIAAFSIMVAITRKKRRIRGLFVFVPVMGIVMSIEMIPGMILMIFTDKLIQNVSNSILAYELVYDIVAYIFVFLWLKRKYIAAKTELGIWERRILNGNGLLLLVIYCISISIPETLLNYEKYILAGGVFISVMIISTTIIMTIKSANANYYKLMAEINEHYLQAQLKHFKSYQETQRKTRRIRHDMKNHMMCVKDLYNRAEYVMLGEYLQELSDLTHNIDKEYHIGNDIADSILNEKYSIAKLQGIEFCVEGNISGINSIALIDICTIFANALDNAIEAVNRAKLPEAVITISVKRYKKLLFISFTNPCNEKPDIEGKINETTKKDTVNHGFGMENMQMVAEKYKGSMQFYIVKGEERQNLFCLEIMLMI